MIKLNFKVKNALLKKDFIKRHEELEDIFYRHMFRQHHPAPKYIISYVKVHLCI